MKEAKNKNTDYKNAMKGYNSKNRDFQRTEEDVDNVNKSEKDLLNERTEKANTKPDKNKIN
jgi:hypothetical protein